MIQTSPFLRIPLQVLQGGLAAFAIYNGVGGLAFGAGLPAEAMALPDNIGLDNLLRFIGGVWTAIGLLLGFGVLHIEAQGPLLRATWGIIFLGGVGQLIGIYRFGYEDPEFVRSAYMEVLAPVGLSLWQYLLSRSARLDGTPRAKGTATAPLLRVPLQILLLLCGSLALVIGGRLLHAGAPLPEGSGDQQGSLDLIGTLHFVSGIWLGVGAVLLGCVFRIEGKGPLLRAAGLIVFLGGMGRLVAILRFGADGNNFRVIAGLEVFLPLVLCAWQYLLLQRTDSSSRGTAELAPHPAVSNSH